MSAITHIQVIIEILDCSSRFDGLPRYGATVSTPPLPGDGSGLVATRRAMARHDRIHHSKKIDGIPPSLMLKLRHNATSPKSVRDRKEGCLSRSTPGIGCPIGIACDAHHRRPGAPGPQRALAGHRFRSRIGKRPSPARAGTRRHVSCVAVGQAQVTRSISRPPPPRAAEAGTSLDCPGPAQRGIARGKFPARRNRQVEGLSGNSNCVTIQHLNMTWIKRGGVGNRDNEGGHQSETARPQLSNRSGNHTRGKFTHLATTGTLQALLQGRRLQHQRSVTNCD